MFTKHLLTLALNAELKNNNTGQSRHWSSAHQEKKIMMLALRSSRIIAPGDGNMMFSEFSCNIMSEPFDRIVDISVLRILGKGQRLWDPDSILRGNCKQLIDSAVDAKILVDDSTRWVGRILGEQCDQQRDRGPSIEISFWEHENGESFSRSRHSFPSDPSPRV